MEKGYVRVTKNFLRDVPGLLVFRGSPEGKKRKVNAVEQENIT